jgi:hypothetical protein
MSTVNGPLSAGSSTNYWRANFNVGSFRDLLSGTSAVSIQAWVKYDPTTGPITERVLLAGHINNTVGGIWLSIGGTGETPGTVQVGGRSQTTDLYQKLNSDTTLIPNEWNHIVGVIDYANDTLRVAINGGAFKTGSANFGSDTFTPGTGTTQPDFISGRSQGSRFIGLIDEVAIWRSALTQDNVEWLYNNSISVPEPTSLVLLGVGMIPLFSWIRRRK